MAEKVLNLKLKYKDKSLDIVRQKRDFTTKFLIGSNKFLFWQILDPNFPDKFPLLVKKGNRYKINLRKNMDVQVRKNNQIINKEELKNAKLLTSNALIIDPATEGEIYIGDNWKIEYNYAIPYKFVPTEEEQQIAKKFSHLPPLDAQQRFTRIFIALGIIFTFAGLYIADVNYQPPEKLDITERLERIEEIATQVQPEIVEAPEERPVSRGRQEEEEVAEEVEQAQEYSAEEFEAEFGVSLDGGGVPGGEGTEDFSNQLLEVTQVEEIRATGPGSGTDQVAARRNRGTSDLDVAGTSGFDLESATTGLGDLGGMEGLGVGDGGFEEVDMSSLSGKVGNYTIHKVQSKADFTAIKKRFAGVKRIKEGSIKVKDATPKARSVRANIDQIVRTYKPQLEKLFRNESMLMDMYGTVEFTLYIASNNRVEYVEVKTVEGSFFTDSFIQKAHDIVKQWKIKVDEAVQYTFRMKFFK